MKWLLKCYYGYRNRGDEVLFFGVVKYLFDHYDDLTVLDVEVGDVSWMSQWCEMNPSWWWLYKDRVRFVSSRRFSMWWADYDVIFAGWGEVLAQKWRNPWHAGFNYLALFWRWIWTRRVVWLWGIETPTVWWSKVLYRMVLPYAREIVCREQGSYEIARKFTDRVVLYHDWAIDVLQEATKGRKRQKENNNCILINSIPKHTAPEIIAQFHEWIQGYPDHQIINFPAEEWDILPEVIRAQYGDRITTRQRREHDIASSIDVFQQADAGFGQRLHFIIPCVYLCIPHYRLVYSEKISKILEFFASSR